MMHTYDPSSVRNLRHRILTAFAACLALVLSVAAAQAEDCQPLYASSIRPIQASVTPQRNEVRFYIEATVKNPNPAAYNAHSNATLYWHFKDSQGRVTNLDPQRPPTHIAPGRTVQFVAGDRFLLRGNAAPQWVIALKGTVVNEQCQDPRKRIAQSEFGYDLNPVRTGGQPKRLYGRITYRADDGSPRPRPGSGAPLARR